MLTNKVAVVTGSGQGIGKHAAKTLAENGAKVVIADLDQAAADATAAELSTVSETMAQAVDVREEEDVTRLFEATIDRFGQVDILVNNAGVVPHFRWGVPRWPQVSDMPQEFWDRVIRTNLYGTFLCSKHGIPFMREKNSGHIINLYGGGGTKPAGALTYMVTKDAIRTFSLYLAEEVRDSNICVVTLSPRFAIATETAPEEAKKSMPGPDVLGDAFVLAAQAPMDVSGRCLAHEDGRLVEEA